jgi:hypothetical protein
MSRISGRLEEKSPRRHQLLQSETNSNHQNRNEETAVGLTSVLIAVLQQPEWQV